MVPASVGLTTRKILFSLSGWRMMTWWRHLMIRPFCKAYDSPARESLECILHWPWRRPSLLRKTMLQGCEGYTSWLWTYTGADGWLTGCWLLVDIQIDRCAEECWNTLPIPWKQNQEAYQLRYVFGCAMDGSDLRATSFGPPGQLNNPSWCIDAWKGDWVRLDKCSYMAPLGIEHFFDAFCFEPQRPWRAAACQALDIPSCHGSHDTYLEQGQESKFSLTPRHIPVERKAPAAKRENDQDMVAKEESVSDAESGWSGVSDNSSTDSECTNVEASSLASDQDRFDTAYNAFRDLANDLYDIDLRRYPRGVTSEDAAGVPLKDGQEKLQELVHLPRTWPLARLTIPLEGLSKQIDRLLEGYCFQILATNRNPATVHDASDRAPLPKELVVARGWSRSFGSMMSEPCGVILTHNATITEPVRGEGTWLVFTCWPQRKALHKQVQTAGRWLERGLAYGRRHCSLASLECCTWPHLAVM